VGLNPLQLVLTGTALEIAILLFEVPTGIVADLYSRRLSIIIGLVTMGIGFMLCAATWFPLIFLAQMVWGLGWTFTSGATNAWLTDEIGETAANRAFSRGTQMELTSRIAGIVVSVLLASINIVLPLFVGGSGMIVLAVFLIFFMPETGFQPTPQAERSTLGKMRYTLGEGMTMVKRRPVLVNILVIGVILGAFSEGYDRLWIAHLLEQFDLPELGSLDRVVWFGIIGIVGALLSIAGTEFSRRRVNVEHPQAIVRALQFVNGVLILALLTFTLAGRFGLMLAAIWLIDLTRHVTSPLFSAWMNQGLDPKVRATVFSMAGQADAIGQLAGGPLIGLVANTFSIRVALLCSTTLLTPIMAMFRITLRDGERLTMTRDIPEPSLSGD
jgi:DHA3 family tetracycline resistance protein-like MFS transporter